ncbi:hypothetical protein [Azospirillum brasilense]|uniref:hypothetical protein n=1 Tax=Azospirillum brasilense TaxID=192 RepID=UPI0032B582CE
MGRPLQERAEFAAQRHVELAALRAGRQRDLLDQPADSVSGLVALLRAIQCFGQTRHLAGIELRNVRVNVGQVHRDLGEAGVQFVLPRLKLPEPRHQGAAAGAALDQRHDVLDGAGDLGQLPALGLAGSAARVVEPVGFLDVGADRLGGDVRRHQLVLQTGQHALFQGGARDGPAVGTSRS